VSHLAACQTFAQGNEFHRADEFFRIEAEMRDSRITIVRLDHGKSGTSSILCLTKSLHVRFPTRSGAAPFSSSRKIKAPACAEAISKWIQPDLRTRLPAHPDPVPFVRFVLRQSVFGWF